MLGVSELAAVILPLASTVIFAAVYAPAATLVLARLTTGLATLVESTFI